MNSNRSATNSRLRKIRIVSRLFRTLLNAVALLLVLGGALAIWQCARICLGGHVSQTNEMTVRISFSASQHYAVASDSPPIPWGVLLLGAIQLAAVPLGFIVLNRLFKLFEKGVFFSSENVRYLKFLGVMVTGSGLVQTTLELMAGGLDVNLLLVGGVILLIAWIMDEARKIHEEQALTV